MDNIWYVSRNEVWDELVILTKWKVKVIDLPISIIYLQSLLALFPVTESLSCCKDRKQEDGEERTVDEGVKSPKTTLGLSQRLWNPYLVSYHGQR